MLQPGDQIGPYTVGSLLGQGGMGAVYRALRAIRLPRQATPLGQREVCLKVAPRAHPQIPDAGERFLREVRLGLRAQHPCILAIEDAGYDEERGLFYGEVRLLSGLDLRALGRRLREAGEYFCAQAAVTIALGALDPLGYLHRLVPPIYHRDVSADNILVGEGGLIALLDLGVALSGDEPQLTCPEIRPGKSSHLSPEYLVDARSIDERHDLYAIGVVLYQMLSGGGLPTRGGMPRLGPDVEIAPIEVYRDPLPADCRALYQAALMLLSADRENRPRTAEDAADLLGAAAGGLDLLAGRRAVQRAMTSVRTVALEDGPDDGGVVREIADDAALTRQATSWPPALAVSAVSRCPTARAIRAVACARR